MDEWLKWMECYLVSIALLANHVYGAWCRLCYDVCDAMMKQYCRSLFILKSEYIRSYKFHVRIFSAWGNRISQTFSIESPNVDARSLGLYNVRTRERKGYECLK